MRQLWPNWAGAGLIAIGMVVGGCGKTKIATMQKEGMREQRMAPATTQSATERHRLATEIDELAERIADKKWSVSSKAICEASRLIEEQRPGTDMAIFLPLFEPLFRHANWGSDPEMAGKVAEAALIRIGKPAVPALLAKIKSEKEHDRWSSLCILARMNAPKELVLSLARGMLRDPDEGVRSVAIQTLGDMGATAMPAVEDLKKQGEVENELLEQQNMIRELECQHVRVEWALIQIQGANRERVAAMAAHLASKDEHGAASYAATILGELGPAARSAAPELTLALLQGAAQTRINAAHALGEIGVLDDAIIEALLDRLKNDSELYVRESAAASLGKIGPKAKAALPALRAASESDSEWWGWSDAIRRIEGPVPTTRPAGASGK